MNRAPFGAGVRGVDAASRFWFDEAAGGALARRGGDARGDPARSGGLRARPAPRPRREAPRPHPRPDGGGRLDDARRGGPREARAARRAGGEGELRGAAPRAGARGGRRGALAGGARGRRRAARTRSAWRRRSRATSSGRSELVARQQVAALGERHVGAAAVVVLENATGEILAYVGSPDFGDPRGGQNDGVRARRQPGSTLKPFVYGLAMERLGWTAATVAAGRTAARAGRGRRVRADELRRAIPRPGAPARGARELAERPGGVDGGAGRRGGRARATARARAGRSTADDAWYGPAIALGDGEVTLLELANAYATIARGGHVAAGAARCAGSSGTGSVSRPPPAVERTRDAGARSRTCWPTCSRTRTRAWRRSARRARSTSRSTSRRRRGRRRDRATTGRWASRGR